MAEIIVTESGTHIVGGDAFLVLKKVMEGRIELPKLTPPSRTKKGKVRSTTITITHPRRVAPTKQVAQKPEKIDIEPGDWETKLRSLTASIENEEKEGNQNDRYCS